MKAYGLQGLTSPIFHLPGAGALPQPGAAWRTTPHPTAALPAERWWDLGGEHSRGALHRLWDRSHPLRELPLPEIRMGGWFLFLDRREGAICRPPGRKRELRPGESSNKGWRGPGRSGALEVFISRCPSLPRAASPHPPASVASAQRLETKSRHYLRLRPKAVNE